MIPFVLNAPQVSFKGQRKRRLEVIILASQALRGNTSHGGRP